MCWSLRVSLGSYAIVCVLSAALLRRNWQTDRWFALWLLFVGQVQILEAGMWLDQECGWLNQAANAALLCVIGLEPLVHSLISLHCTPAKLRSPHQKTLAYVAAANVALFLAVSVPGTTSWCSRPCGADAHLRWPWAENISDPLRLASSCGEAPPRLSPCGAGLPSSALACPCCSATARHLPRRAPRRPARPDTAVTLCCPLQLPILLSPHHSPLSLRERHPC